MKKSGRFPLLILFFNLVLGSSALFALDVRDGLVRVVVDETMGRAILYRLAGDGGSSYEPLLFDADARTSFLTLSLDGRKIKLGESQEFKIGVRRAANGAAIEFSSPVISITQRIEFVKSADSRISNGFKITCEARNLSQRDSKVALRQVWDTILGEKSGVHFMANGIARFDTELVFRGETMVPFLVSPGPTASLGIILDQVPRPDVVVVANWKRLSDSNWSYDSPMRGYSLPPYSTNDSAIGLYWNEIILKAGASHLFVSYFLTGGEGQEFFDYLKSGPAFAAEQPAPPTAAPDPISGTAK